MMYWTQNWQISQISSMCKLPSEEFAFMSFIWSFKCALMLCRATLSNLYSLNSFWQVNGLKVHINLNINPKSSLQSCARAFSIDDGVLSINFMTSSNDKCSFNISHFWKSYKNRTKETECNKLMWAYYPAEELIIYIFHHFCNFILPCTLQLLWFLDLYSISKIVKLLPMRNKHGNNIFRYHSWTI